MPINNLFTKDIQPIGCRKFWTCHYGDLCSLIASHEETLHATYGAQINFTVSKPIIPACAVPEKYHTHPMEGHWEFLGGGGS